MRTMNEELLKQESETSTLSTTLEPPLLPITSQSRESLSTKSANGIFLGLKVRSTIAPADPMIAQRVRRQLNSKHKAGDNDMTVLRERELDYTKIVDPEGNCKVYEEESGVKVKELHDRVDGNESFVKELQSEVTILRTRLEKLQGRNVELETQKKWLVENLLAAKAKISALEKHDQVALDDQEIKVLKFRDMQRILEEKLSHSEVKKAINKEDKKPNVKSSALTSGPKSSEVQSKNFMKVSFPPPPNNNVTIRGFPPPPSQIQHSLLNGPPPPPPPPPLPLLQVPCRAKAMHKAQAVAELYNSLAKRDGNTAPLGRSNGATAAVNNAHNSIVDEIQNRSAHLLVIKTDVDTKGDFIRFLIERVQASAFEDIDDVLSFVDWLDKELSTLSDERAVLKHFNWPEKKADALREAAFEYRDLKRLEIEASSFTDDISVPYGPILKKIAALMDKLEKSIQRLIKMRDVSILSFKGCKIPTDWMLDSGMVSKIKLASVRLAKVYMKRVSMELKAVHRSDKESTYEALLCNGVRFAYRTHQLAGGFDSETMSVFEELRKLVQVRGKG